MRERNQEKTEFVEVPETGRRKRKKKKYPFAWIVSIFFIICFFTFLPSLSSFVFLGAGVLLLPIKKIQQTVRKILPNRLIKGLVCAVLAVVAIATAPTEDTFKVETFEEPPAVIEQQVDAPTEVNEKEEKPVEVEEPEEEQEELPVVIPVEGEAEDNKPEEPKEEETQTPENSTFEIHFIDVGQADASLILCDGKAMLIDGGNSEDSSLIYSYLKNQNISHLDYIIATHGHEDHVGGLSGALNYATVGTAYCSVDSYDSEAFEDFVKYLGKQNRTITIPSPGDTFKLGSASVQIVGIDGTATDHNDSSIVLRVVYGETSFLFTGDAEREAEQTILSSGYELESTVLKVGHHGSENSTSYVFLREVAPKYGVISVGENNSYGHPTEEALSRLRDADVSVYRTDLQGTIVCVSDGKNVSFTVSRNADADTFPFLPFRQ